MPPRNSIGLIVVGGMAIGTFFTLFVVPALYLLIARDHSSEGHGAILRSTPGGGISSDPWVVTHDPLTLRPAAEPTPDVASVPRATSPSAVRVVGT